MHLLFHAHFSPQKQSSMMTSKNKLLSVSLAAEEESSWRHCRTLNLGSLKRTAVIGFEPDSSLSHQKQEKSEEGAKPFRIGVDKD